MLKNNTGSELPPRRLRPLHLVVVVVLLVSLVAGGVLFVRSRAQPAAPAAFPTQADMGGKPYDAWMFAGAVTEVRVIGLPVFPDGNLTVLPSPGPFLFSGHTANAWQATLFLPGSSQSGNCLHVAVPDDNLRSASIVQGTLHVFFKHALTPSEQVSANGSLAVSLGCS